MLNYEYLIELEKTKQEEERTKQVIEKNKQMEEKTKQFYLFMKIIEIMKKIE